MKNRLLAIACLIGSAATPAVSQTPIPEKPAAPDTATTVTFGGFIDSYYAFDFDRPANFDRSFTTQPARHNEFNVNLAYVEAKVSGPRVRGRLALQAGTSVQSNYSGEPAIGAVSGAALSRFIQEAVAGYRITPSLWVDGGIFLSHIGMEGFISRDNLTYTRSLSADFTPYYESGAKLTWQPSPRITTTFVVMNGWQNISENNADKSVGLRIDYAPGSQTTLSYYDFLGKENTTSLLRTFNGVGLKRSLTPTLTVQGNFDYGMQKRETGGHSTWYSGGLTAKLQTNPLVGVSGRVEEYRDPDQVVIVTGTSAGFKGTTASAGVDVTPLGTSRVLWRNELRGTWTSDPVFPRGSSASLSNDNYLLVTSLALTF